MWVMCWGRVNGSRGEKRWREEGGRSFELRRGRERSTLGVEVKEREETFVMDKDKP